MSEPANIELLKSSAEILTELFSSFNAEPPNLEQKVSKKHKKSKKKHKHKDKKHKKKSKHKHSSDTSEDSSSEKGGYRKHKSKKRSKDSDSGSNSIIVKSSDIDLSRVKKEPREDKPASAIDIIVKTEPIEKENVKQELNTSDNIVHKKENNVAQTENPESLKVSELSEAQKESISDKITNKITIKNLKNSSVYEATIKEVEEKAREKAARFEEGELTESEIDIDDDNNVIDELLAKVPAEKSSSKSERKRKHSHRDRDRDSSKEKRSKHEEAKKPKKDKHRSYKSRSRSREKDRHASKRDKDDYYSHRSSHSYRDSSNYDRYKSRDDRRRSRSRSKDRSRSKSSRDRSNHRSDRRRRSKSPSSSIDKKKLLEIARKNAINMLKSGTLPEALTLGPQAQEKVIAAIKAGGKTIEELTEFCKNLSKKEELGELSSVSSNEDEIDSASENERVFHHPFQIKDKPTSIVMNIKNSTPLPVKTPKEKSAELRMQFPVSSGQLHRKTENEWVPVSPKKTEAPALLAIQAAPVVIPQPVPKPVIAPTVIPVPAKDKIPVPQSQAEVDISTIVSQRLNAMRKLQENPNDVQAIGQMYRVQQEMQSWAQSKQQPGQFTGSTGAQILSAAELSSGYQAWARKDQLQNAAPVTGGMGMHLLQKMGWKPGEGLGKEKTGSLEPLLLEVKLDKKGLVANEEVKNKRPAKVQRNSVTVKTLAGKHPVSLLGEFATKRKMGVPQYELCFECGPDHKKNFLYKVILNGIEYKPNIASSTKKQAKADAASVCLQQLGILPS